MKAKSAERMSQRGKERKKGRKEARIKELEAKIKNTKRGKPLEERQSDGVGQFFLKISCSVMRAWKRNKREKERERETERLKEERWWRAKGTAGKTEKERDDVG